MRATVRAKLLTSFIIILALMGALGWIAIDRMSAMDQMAGEMYLKQSQGIFTVKDAKNDLSTMGIAIRTAAVAGDASTLDGAVAMWGMAEKMMKARLQRLGALVTNAEAKEALAKVVEAWEKGRYVHDILLTTAQSGRQRDRIEMLPEMRTLINESQNTERAVVAAMDSLVELLQLEAEKAYSEMRRQDDAARTLMLAIMLLALAVSIAVAFLLARSIIVSLGKIEKTAMALATGDVEQQLAVRGGGGDEIGRVMRAFSQVVEYMRDMAGVADSISKGDLSLQVSPRSPKDALGTAFERMVTNLRSMVSDVSSSASALAEASQQMSENAGQAGAATQQIAITIQQVASGNQQQSAAVQDTSSSVNQLSKAIEQIAKGAQEQARSIERASVSVDQLNDSIAKVTAASKEVSSATQEVEAVATTGAGVVQNSIKGMATIRERTHSAASEVQDLTKYSEQIGSIVEAIDDIAEQTNLLALNAAIEAARAGEHGRGFAVVADEVRKLAERSSRSTREIANLIGHLKREIDEAVSAMELGLKDVEEGSRLAEQAGEALASITRSVKGASHQVSQIAVAVRRMEEASREVVDLMHNVSAVVQESTAAAEEMAASSHQVDDAMDRMAAISEETSAAAEEVSASTEEVSAQVEEMVAQSQQLAQMAEDLQAAIAQFRLEKEGEIVMRRRKDDWNQPALPKPASDRTKLRPV